MKPEELKFNFPYQFSKITGYEGAIIVKWGAHLDYVKYLEERLKYFMESNETIVVQLTAEVRRREELQIAVNELITAIGPCTCHEAFKDRKLTDPDCRYCDFVGEIEIIKSIVKEQEGR